MQRRKTGISAAHLVLVGFCSVLLAACGGGGGTSPGAAQATSSSPSVSPAGVATLTWNAPNQTLGGSCVDVASYQVHYGTSPASLGQTQNVPSGSVSCVNSGASDACGPIQSCTDPVGNLSSGVWYFAVQVTDTSGQQSGYSSVASTPIP